MKVRAFQNDLPAFIAMPLQDELLRHGGDLNSVMPAALSGDEHSHASDGNWVCLCQTAQAGCLARPRVPAMQPCSKDSIHDK